MFSTINIGISRDAAAVMEQLIASRSRLHKELAKVLLVHKTEPYVAVATVLASIGLVSSLIPARNAASVRPCKRRGKSKHAAPHAGVAALVIPVVRDPAVDRTYESLTGGQWLTVIPEVAPKQGYFRIAHNPTSTSKKVRSELEVCERRTRLILPDDVSMF